VYTNRKINTVSFKALVLKSFKACLSVLFILLVSAEAHAQLPPFALNAVPAHETCLGNGSLNFSVSGTVPGATVSYAVYLLPNLTTPVGTVTGSSLGGLVSGNYTVIATETLAGETISVQVDVTIEDHIILLDYTISSVNAFCGPDGSMTVNVLSGNPALYEILSGPLILPAQPSPVFTGIPAGVYVIRVYDNCGEAVVVTHTVQSDATQVTAEDATFPDEQLPSCTTISAVNILNASEDDILIYPLILDYTIFPPDGSTPIELTQTLTNGALDGQEATMIIPFYHGQQYSYNLVITDACGNTFPSTHIVDVELQVFLSPMLAECGQFYLSALPMKYVEPYNLTFISMPAGFDPLAFNAGYPGPYTTSPVDFGSSTNPVPFGDYLIEITDACGRTAQATATLIPPDLDPVVSPTANQGCNGNFSEVEITLPGFEFVSAIITAAPSSYPNPLDDDVSEFITAEGAVLIPDMPYGNYTIVLIDDCGNEYVKDFEILPADPIVSTSIRADCDPGIGSIRMRGMNTQLLSVIMTAAPAGFPQSMPYDVTFNIGDGVGNTTLGTFSMAGLPAGQYVFEVVDSCNFTHTKTINVPIYSVTASNFVVTPHCGSFDLSIEYTANGFSTIGFWLQKFNPVTGTWGHPSTGAVYTDETFPTSVNSLELVNNSNNLNLQFLGQFRLVRTYEGFGNGSESDFNMCFDVVHEFTFTGFIELTGFQKVTCDGFYSDVEVFTNGVPPIHYTIIAKDGVPFFVDNGTNSVFNDLEPAVYTFAVSHACGDTRTGFSDVALLPSLANATQPGDLVTCDDATNDGAATFDLSAQTATILGTQNPSDYTVTYHATPDDTDNNMNALPLNYTTTATTIYARVSYNNGDCYAATSFNLIIKPSPVVTLESTYGLCEGQTRTLAANFGFDSYSWSNGATTRVITVSTPGVYTVDVTKDYGSLTCSGSASTTVVVSNAPEIEEITFTDWTESDNTITVTLSQNSIGTYLYSIDNANWQSSPVFTGLTPGPYTVYVKDDQECGADQAEVYLLNYPNFFTPNEDGFNDFWRVPFSEVEPHLETFIYDRYGKLITGFGVDSQGWDGTLNGRRLPSTDYWFVVIRENGKQHRGHFSMKR
jgi:gliding motility-associated-like protein